MIEKSRNLTPFGNRPANNLSQIEPWSVNGLSFPNHLESINDSKLTPSVGNQKLSGKKIYYYPLSNTKPEKAIDFENHYYKKLYKPKSKYTKTLTISDIYTNEGPVAPMIKKTNKNKINQKGNAQPSNLVIQHPDLLPSTKNNANYHLHVRNICFRSN